MKQIFVSLIALVASLQSEATPPTTPQALVVPELDMTISLTGTDWFESFPPNDNPQILMLFRSPRTHKSVQPTLTIRRDKATEEDDLKKYARQWTKEMSRFGIKVLGSQFFSRSEQVGYALDLSPEGSIKRQRQTLFMKGQDVVVLTCTSHKEEFKSTLRDCNRIIENFSWNENGRGTLVRPENESSAPNRATGPRRETDPTTLPASASPSTQDPTSASRSL